MPISEVVKRLRHELDDQHGRSADLLRVVRSSDPHALAFLREALSDPKAPPAWRRQAFLHLAGTGGSADVELVRRTRDALKPPQPGHPWFEQLNPDDPDQCERLDERTDARGRIWRLFQSTFLGNPEDLFVVLKQGRKWGRPVFTGVWTNRTAVGDPPTHFGRTPMAQLVAGEWIKVLPEDASIRRDADGDGLTDVTEERLGLDPQRKDTDGDGRPDGIDPFPNARSRPLDDRQKIVRACVQALFFDSDSDGRVLLEAPGVTPFSFPCSSTPVLWPPEHPARPEGPSRFYGQNYYRVTFLPPGPNRQGAGFIEYDSTGTAARTHLVLSFGLGGSSSTLVLRKIGPDWFVVDEEDRTTM